MSGKRRPCTTGECRRFAPGASLRAFPGVLDFTWTLLLQQDHGAILVQSLLQIQFRSHFTGSHPRRGGRSDSDEFTHHLNMGVSSSLSLNTHRNARRAGGIADRRVFFATTTSKPHDRPHEFGVTVCPVPSRIIFRKTSVSRINL